MLYTERGESGCGQTAALVPLVGSGFFYLAQTALAANLVVDSEHLMPVEVGPFAPPGALP
jgi:hypothetical protein